MKLLYENLVIIGSSAGGPRILRYLFNGLPRINCAMVLIQHMPKFINQSICDDLNELTMMNMLIAGNGDVLQTGNVYIAPTDFHLVLSNNKEVNLVQTPKVNFVRPAVDVTMQSVLSLENGILMGIILTGMGRDGADGIVHMKKMGAINIAQNEATSIIYGMPKEAAMTGCVDYEMSPQQIQNKMVQVFGKI